MSDGPKMPLASARTLAEKIVAELAPGCERLAIAGSVRRAKPLVGDIEIVAVPKLATNLFGDPAGSRLDPIIDDLLEAGRLEKLKRGPKYGQYLLPRAGCKAAPVGWALNLVSKSEHV